MRSRRPGLRHPERDRPGHGHAGKAGSALSMTAASSFCRPFLVGLFSDGSGACVSCSSLVVNGGSAGNGAQPMSTAETDRDADGAAAESASAKSDKSVPASDCADLAFGKTRRKRDKDHRAFVASKACLVCGRHPADAHHVRFAQPRALGRKVSDEFTVPLCRIHHRRATHARRRSRLVGAACN